MRPHPTQIEPDDRLERLWAATRPDEPSAEQFDRLWGEVIARASEPEIIAFGAARTWGLRLAIFAQAAALLVAAALALKPPMVQRHNTPAASEDVAVVEPHAVAAPEGPAVLELPEFLVQEGTVAIVHLGSDRGAIRTENRPQPTASDTDQTGVDVAVLNFMESYE